MKRLVAGILLLALLVVAAGCDAPGDTLLVSVSGKAVLTYARTGGIAGFQDRLIIGAGGEYYLTQQANETIGSISSARRKVLDNWMAKYAHFTLTLEDNPGGVDSMKRQAVWTGNGTTIPTDAEQRQVLEWAAALVQELTAKP
jgi:hypothetical protein